MAVSFIRTLILYIAIIAAMRFMGKRQLSQLEPSELVVAVLISDLASNPLQDVSIPLSYGLIPVAVLVCCEILVSGLIMKSVRFGSFIGGKTSILVRDGVIDENEMRKNRFTPDDLLCELRSQGFLNVVEVKYAVLETDGSVSVLPFPKDKPVTAQQLGIPVTDRGCPTIIIEDGRVLEKNMHTLGRDDKWLTSVLRKNSIRSPKEVYLLLCDEKGGTFLAKKEKKR